MGGGTPLLELRVGSQSGAGRTMDGAKQITLVTQLFITLAFKSQETGTSLVAQWLRIRLPMQGHGFEPWSRKIPHAVE